MKKVCSKCKKEKDINNFHKQNSVKSGFRSYCKECGSIYRKKHFADNKNKILEQNKEYRLKNKSKIHIYEKKYRTKNADEIRRRRKIYRRNTAHFRLKKNISSCIYKRLKARLSSKKLLSTFDFLPYTIDELKKHLEKQFIKGMNWNNYGKWHIDHIKPDSSFNYKSVEDKEFQECWSLNNLQPLWAKDNLIKSNKILS